MVMLAGYMGCMSIPTLPATLTDQHEMTSSQCIESCRGLDRTFAAVHLRDCYCLDDLSGLTKGDYEECMEGCEGNMYQLCGGPSRVSVYKPGEETAQYYF
jgi:hypothetical protein